MAIEISKNNHIGTLTINRPDSLNAMNREVLIEFINGLNKCGIKIDRKILAEIAYDSPEAFKTIVQKAQSALN